MPTSLLVALLLLAMIAQAWDGPWSPCTDLLPLDLLSRALPTAGGAPQGLRLVQDQGTWGLRLVAPAGHRALSFPASRLFVNCDLFPAEFSIVVTLKVSHRAAQRGEYIFSLVEEELDLLLLGLQVGQEKLQLLVQDGSGQRQIAVRSVPLADGRWHTLVLSVTGCHATVTMDSDTLFETSYDRPFPVTLHTTGSIFYIGSYRALRGLFSGLLRQLVLLPALDAASRICPASDPRLTVLSVPPALLEIPVIPLGDGALMHPRDVAYRYVHITDVPCRYRGSKAKCALPATDGCSTTWDQTHRLLIIELALELLCDFTLRRFLKVGDSQLAALGNLRFLRRLTLAHLPGMLKGTGLLQLVQGCKDLQVLSLANLGCLKTVNYMQSLVEALKHCTQLREFRLEQPYFNANAAFFEALSRCRRLRRLCLVSHHGTFQPAAMVTFMQSCADVIMCHMFMGGTLVACKTLQKTLLDSLSASRPALSVVVYPLLHEDLGHMIREMPLCHLDETTLFKSRVAEEPTIQ